MAWFDYAAALGQGLGQGVEQMRQTRAERRLISDRMRAQELEDRRQALAELELQDPDNISPEWVARYGRVAKDFVRKGPEGFVLRESPQALEARRLELAKQQDARASLTERETARQMVANPDFRSRPLEERLRALELLGAKPSTINAYMTKDERAQLVRESPEWMIAELREAGDTARLGQSLRANREIAAMSGRGPQTQAGRITQTQLYQAAVKIVTENERNKGKTEQQLTKQIQAVYSQLLQNAMGTPMTAPKVPRLEPLMPGSPMMMEIPEE